MRGGRMFSRLSYIWGWGEDRWHCVGAYLLTSVRRGRRNLLTAAIRVQPADARFMVLGDLNTDLDSP